MKNTNKTISKKERNYQYQNWLQYDKVIRSLHQSNTSKKVDRKEKFFNWSFKFLIVFFGAFLTTLTFDLLLRPNDIYNSGLNGILQTFFNWLAGQKNIVRSNYALFLFGTSLLINLAIIFILGRYFQGKWDMMSTALFYSFAQLFWSWSFNKWQLNKYLFNSFAPENWNNFINERQVGFTLPFYVAIAIGAAVVHTWAYSLIFQAKATPGGLEIITSHLAEKKESKISLSFFFKAFGFLVVFLITLGSFLFIDDNRRIKESKLEVYLLEENKKLPIEERFMKESDNINKVLEVEAKNFHLFTLLKNKIGRNNEHFDNEHFIDETTDYLREKSDLIVNLRERIENKNKDEEYLKYLKEKLEKAEKDYCERSFLGYLKYITNNERLWATIVYIFFSSLLISQMFPKDIQVVLNVQTKFRSKLDEILDLLKEFDPFYYVTYSYEQKSPGEEKTIFVVNCYLNKWRYYLLQSQLKQLKTTFFISEAN